MNYGLYMRSYPESSTLWSELEIENGKPFNLNNQFSIAFDLLVREECPFGYVFRAVTDKNEHIDLFLSVGSNDKRLPSLRVLDSIYTFSGEIERNIWISSKIEINKSKQLIIFSFGDHNMHIPFKSMTSNNIRFTFGKSSIKGLETKDIASINIRDIKINRNDVLIRHWPLKKHYNNLSYDEINNVPAISNNAEWIIDNHLNLKPIFKRDFNLAPSVGFNSKSGVFYLISDSESIIIFDAKNISTNKLEVEDGHFVANSPNQLVFIDDKDDLISYRFNPQIYSFYDSEKNSWSNKDAKFIYSYEHDYWNNSANYNSKNSSILSFGGYGYYRFNNNLVEIYPYDSDLKNKNVKLHDISPRSASSTVIYNDTLYIFGGHGTTSGHQELGTENYYDLYAVDLKTLQVKKLIKIDIFEGADFLPSENMIYDKEQKCFYLFVTQNGGKIIKLDPSQNTKEDLSYPLDINFASQYLYTNFYYSESLSKYYVFINQINVDNTSEVSIYSIDAPLIPVNSVVVEAAHMNNLLFIYLIIVLILAVICILMIYSLKRKKGSKLLIDDADKIIEENDNKNILIYEDYHKNIYFFGLFQVFDKEDDDISNEFSPTLRNLLILLIVYTLYNKGISGKEMMRILWPDKDEDLAKNSRNVHISKLRTILDKIGEIKIINKNKMWSLEMDELVKCDYIDIMNFIPLGRKQLTDGQLNEIIHILSRGTLLTDFESDWLDKFKNDFSNQIIDILYYILEDGNYSDSIKLKICDILFQLDYLNERALVYKCNLLNKYGKKGIAMNVFDSFCVEYQKSLGIPYPNSLINILNLK